MADQDDRTFCVPDRPLGGGDVVVQRVERVLDCNDLESGLFEIRNDFPPARPVRKRTVDKDCGLGFQLGSRSWQADRGHRGQEEAQTHNAFARFHGYAPSFGGDWCCRRRDQHEAIERYERERTIYNKEQRGQFPQRFYPTSRCVVWDLAEVVTLAPLQFRGSTS